MAPDRAQKIAKAPTAGATAGVSSLWPKISAAKTKRFLTHCRGRSETKTAATAAPAPTTADVVSEADDRTGSVKAVGGVAGVDDEGGLAYDGLPVVAGVGGEDEDEVVGGEVSDRPRDGREPQAVDIEARHERIVIGEIGALGQQAGDDLQGRRVARVGHVRLVGHAEHEH